MQPLLPLSPHSPLTKLIITLLLSMLFLIAPTSYAQPPPIQHATQFREDINIKNYYVSEKLDGIRAYWDGTQLISKQGNVFTAPSWFIALFPAQPLDGELWTGRQQFEKVASIVLTQDNNNPRWQEVRFMIFDLPASKIPFEQRITRINQLVEQSKTPYLKVIKQQKIQTIEALQHLLDNTVANKGEGLILHHKEALYQTKRNNELMKLKKFEDAEAIVIEHLPGKGKYKGMLGAILVETETGIRFKIGSGFSDKERQTPPPIGSTITYKFTGRTNNDIPRFASFMRIRTIY